MVLFCRRYFLTAHGDSRKAEAADEQQSDPKPHHAIVAGRGIVGLCRKTYVVFTGIALAVIVFIRVSFNVLFVTASTFIPMVIFVRLPIGTVVVRSLNGYAIPIGDLYRSVFIFKIFTARAFVIFDISVFGTVSGFFIYLL